MCLPEYEAHHTHYRRSPTVRQPTGKPGAWLREGLEEPFVKDGLEPTERSVNGTKAEKNTMDEHRQNVVFEQLGSLYIRLHFDLFENFLHFAILS